MNRVTAGLWVSPIRNWGLFGLFLGLSVGWGSVSVVSADEIRLEYRGAGKVIPAAAVSESELAPPSVAGNDQKNLPEGPEHLLVRGFSSTIREALAKFPRDPKPWQRVFRVSLEGIDAALPPLMGSYTLEADGLVFTPRFPLRPGQAYRATIDLTHVSELASSERSPSDSDPRNRTHLFMFRVPASEPSVESASGEAPRLLTVFPSGSVLPENQLKFYLHFSTPMRRGEAYRHVRLWVARTAANPSESTSRDDEVNIPETLAGHPDWEQIEFPFLELPEELWDPKYQRFTLFFDPGRIKRGLKPREQFGPALEEGRRYVLEVDRAWRSASGEPLAETFRKPFRVIEPDDAQPDVLQWTLVSPEHAEGWLQVRFDEPLDNAMLERVIHVEDQQGTQVVGGVMIDQHERRWSFRPAEPWRDGSYHVVVGTHLEDRAGNSLAKPFEVDLFDEVESRVETSHVRLEFRVGTCR